MHRWLSEIFTFIKGQSMWKSCRNVYLFCRKFATQLRCPKKSRGKTHPGWPASSYWHLRESADFWTMRTKMTKDFAWYRSIPHLLMLQQNSFFCLMRSHCGSLDPQRGYPNFTSRYPLQRCHITPPANQQWLPQCPLCDADRIASSAHSRQSSGFFWYPVCVE